MNYEFFHNFLSEMENLQVFALCKEFDKLSLEGITGGSSSSVPASSSSTSLVQSYRDTMHTFFNNLHSNILDHISWPIVEKLQALSSSHSSRKNLLAHQD